MFAQVAEQLESRRTRNPGRRYQIEWALKGIIRCGICGRGMTPHTIRYRKVLYRYYKCRSSAGGQPPCGHQVVAHLIEVVTMSMLRSRWRVRIQREMELRTYIKDLVYDPRNGTVTARVHVPEEVAQPDSGQPAADDAQQLWEW